MCRSWVVATNKLSQTKILIPSFTKWRVSFLLDGGKMEIKKGYVYHIKDEYFDIVQDSTLMRNHESRKSKTYIFLYKK